MPEGRAVASDETDSLRMRPKRELQCRENDGTECSEARARNVRRERAGGVCREVFKEIALRVRFVGASFGNRRNNVRIRVAAVEFFAEPRAISVRRILDIRKIILNEKVIQGKFFAEEGFVHADVNRSGNRLVIVERRSRADDDEFPPGVDIPVFRENFSVEKRGREQDRRNFFELRRAHAVAAFPLCPFTGKNLRREGNAEKVITPLGFVPGFLDFEDFDKIKESEARAQIKVFFCRHAGRQGVSVASGQRLS